jgi:predicted O-methyltransferase YrrM
VTLNGTAMYEDYLAVHPVPNLVREAVVLSERFHFTYSVHPHTGRLLAALAGGVVAGRIGETGAGTGVGLAWMHGMAPADTQLISIELNRPRAEATAELFADCPNVTVLCGDANELAAHAPFDLLVLDAPGDNGPMSYGEVDPIEVLTSTGTIVKDDLWPMSGWPPQTVDGAKDDLRRRLLEHPALFSTEVQVAEGFAAVIGRRKPPA